MLMNIHQATNEYEVWLSRHLSLVEADLAFKHARMAEDPFSFFRATFLSLGSAVDRMGFGSDPSASCAGSRRPSCGEFRHLA